MVINTIFLDMDGVVVHHFVDLGRLFGIDVSRDHWPVGKTNIKGITGTPPDEFYSRVVEAGENLGRA